jgi:S-adenosyl methyltransferase
MVDRPGWAPDDVDLTRPSVARVYDYYLGGSHNFESDRSFARQVLAVMPDMPHFARENRAFLRRAVRHLCRSGIGQFLDLGSGIPTVGNVHSVARSVDPGATVVYVDNDPVAVAHSRRILAGDDRTAVVAADLREPRTVLAQAAERLDLSRPVAVLLVAVLHFVGDESEPAGLVADYMNALVPGSHLVICHATADGPPAAVDLRNVYNRSAAPMRMRSHEEITALFGTLRMLDPGIVRLPLWRPDSPEDVPADAGSCPAFVGVGLRD